VAIAAKVPLEFEQPAARVLRVHRLRLGRGQARRIGAWPEGLGVPQVPA
jgi:hypothetical protein